MKTTITVSCACEFKPGHLIEVSGEIMKVTDVAGCTTLEVFPVSRWQTAKYYVSKWSQKIYYKTYYWIYGWFH